MKFTYILLDRTAAALYIDFFWKDFSSFEEVKETLDKNSPKRFQSFLNIPSTSLNQLEHFVVQQGSLINKKYINEEEFYKLCKENGIT